MAIAAFVISAIGLAIVIIGLIIQVTRHMTKMDVYMKDIRKERGLLRRIPHHEFRLSTIESKLDISVPDYIEGNGRDHDE